jgi:hypothetical protein
MAFPERRRIEEALLEEIMRLGGSVRTRDVYYRLADRFRLSADDLALINRAGQ